MRRGYARYAAYPAATVAGIFTNSIFGFMKGYVLLAVLAGGPSPWTATTVPTSSRSPR